MGVLTEKDDVDDDGGTRPKHTTEEVVELEDSPEVAEVQGDVRIAEQDDEQEDDAEKRREKETAKERRERAKRAKERDRRELEFQRKEIARLDAKLAEVNRQALLGRASDLDQRIVSAKERESQFGTIFAAAITKQQGADAAEAQRLQREASDQVRAFESEKLRLQQAAQQVTQQAQQRPQPTPTAVQRQANRFFEKNSWYNHDDDGDEETLIVKAIDARVAQEYDPSDPEYWTQLQERVQKRLPHHFSDEDEGESPRRKGPPTGGSSRSSSTNGSKGFALSAERVQALKEAGYWDDPKKRQVMAKRYADMDRNNSRG